MERVAGSLSVTTQALLDKLLGRPSGTTGDKDESPKIIFCSRTHSQLTQFVNELRRATPPSSMPANMPTAATVERIKHVSLGSRKNLCINERVSRLPSTTAINEQCLELQKPDTSTDKKCKFLPSKDSQDTLSRFKDLAMAGIRDIEDLGKIGKDLKICPYYASRSSIEVSEIMTLPYPLLLQKSAREAMGISVKDNIVIIDEAHNLMDAIAETYGASLRMSQLHTATSQLTVYLQKFKHRLKGSNRVYVTQVYRLLQSISDGVQALLKNGNTNQGKIDPLHLLSGRAVDQIDSRKLIKYISESKLAHKVDGYSEVLAQIQHVPYAKGSLMQAQSLMLALMNPSPEGSFFYFKDGSDITIKYTLLDPTQHFRDIVEEARAVILAGGTMSPMQDYADYLFSYLPEGRLKTFSFGHVIPPRNLTVSPIVTGSSGVEFNFTFTQRNNANMIVELGQAIQLICQAVPDGVVVFFPSYEYLSTIMKEWRQSTGDTSILAKLQKAKQVFEETRDVTKGQTIETLLHDYAQGIDTGKGGLLLSVVGGKLSEGINFSDKLGRAVIVVGLPFPNSQSAEWKAKLEHVEKSQCLRIQQKQPNVAKAELERQTKAASRDFYENACMRAVNQCIGRAIRHRNDYAAILLIDRRFVTERIQKKLPAWIRSSLPQGGAAKSVNNIVSTLEDFFRGKE